MHIIIYMHTPRVSIRTRSSSMHRPCFIKKSSGMVSSVIRGHVFRAATHIKLINNTTTTSVVCTKRANQCPFSERRKNRHKDMPSPGDPHAFHEMESTTFPGGTTGDAASSVSP